MYHPLPHAENEQPHQRFYVGDGVQITYGALKYSGRCTKVRTDAGGRRAYIFDAKATQTHVGVDFHLEVSEDSILSGMVEEDPFALDTRLIGA
jgi:hypothetical protein